jgi:hypothetical protein
LRNRAFLSAFASTVGLFMSYADREPIAPHLSALWRVTPSANPPYYTASCAHHI